MDPKGNVFLNRYIHLAHAIHDGASDQTAGSTTMTISELATLWECSERAAQESVQRLENWGLLRWTPQAGRGKRSDLALLVHPVHVYYERAQRALMHGALAEAGFWLNEVMRECSCIPAAAALLSNIRQRLGLADITRCCDEGLVRRYHLRRSVPPNGPIDTSPSICIPNRKHSLRCDTILA